MIDSELSATTDDFIPAPSVVADEGVQIYDHHRQYEQRPSILQEQPPRSAVVPPATSTQQEGLNVSSILTTSYSYFDAVNPVYLVSPPYTNTAAVPASSSQTGLLSPDEAEQQERWKPIVPENRLLYRKEGVLAPPPSVLSQPRGQVSYPGGDSLSSY